jgi:hypothetical protein
MKVYFGGARYDVRPDGLRCYCRNYPENRGNDVGAGFAE